MARKASKLGYTLQRRIVGEVKCTLRDISLYPSNTIKFRDIAIGTQYTMNIEIAVSNPADGERPWTTLYIEFNSLQDPGGMYASKQRTVICTVKLMEVKNSREVKEIPMDKAYYGVTVWSMEGFRYQSSVSIEIQITEPHRKPAECPMNLFLKSKVKMYEAGLLNGDMTLRCNGDMTLRCIENPLPKKRRKIVEDDSDQSEGNQGIDDNITMIKTFSYVLRSASVVFDSMLSHQMKEGTEKVIEIQGATSKDVDDLVYYICCCDLRKNANPRALIKMAHLYELKGLFQACLQRIVSDLEVDNFVESVQVFTRFHIEEGFQDLVQFGRLNLKELKEEESFHELPFLFRFGLLNVPDKKSGESDTVLAEIC